MKKFLLALSILGIVSAEKAMAQSTFVTQKDTASEHIFPGTTTSVNILNEITVQGTTAPDSTIILWKAIVTDFPEDWLASNVLGVCDNINCRINLFGAIWDSQTQSGAQQESDFYKKGVQGDFHMQLDPTNMVTNGTHYMTLTLVDSFTKSSTKNITFAVTNGWPTGIAVTTKTEGVMLYPNPANDHISLVVNGNANVNSYAVYDMTGKMLNTSGNMNGQVANINLQNVPAGIYFVRLFDAQGSQVATAKFNRL